MLPVDPPPSTTHTPWSGAHPPGEAELQRLLTQEGLVPRWWSSGPSERFPGHTHPYHKVLYCADGAIRFIIEHRGEVVDLAAGDRLDLPPCTRHSAVVGPTGVRCVEAARY